ncbi:hypothetical protein IW262DRAFT_1302230 [Armillaria fumosa]|nr:hypothetical protein IW262DRAFT_1302230 [Armillaria fumosa]
MNSPRDLEDWEVPVSEIRDWTYTLIDLFGIENVGAFRVRAMGYPMYERDAMKLAYEGELLIKLESSLETERSRSGHRKSDGLEKQDDAPTLDGREYEQWLQATFRKEQHHHDKKASKERNVGTKCAKTRVTNQKVADFLHRKRDDQAQHHRARCDEPTNTIYINMAPVGPSGLTMTVPRQSYPPLRPVHWHQAYEAASPTSQPPTPAFAAGYPGWFGPPR